MRESVNDAFQGSVMSVPGHTLAERLAWLRENFPDPDTGRPYEVKVLAAAAGISVSGLYKILSGESPNPGWQHLRQLAAVFGVPLDSFDDDERGEQIRTQLATLVAMRELQAEGVHSVSLRGLTPAQADRIRGVVEDLRQSNTTTPTDHDEA